QSTYPPSMRGTRQDIPMPAGVIAPVRLRPTVVVGSASIFLARSPAASRRRPALYARNWSSTRRVIDWPAVTGGGWILLPFMRASLRFGLERGVIDECGGLH